MSKRSSGDDIGQTSISGYYRAGYLGPLVVIGDRVQMRRHLTYSAVRYATWGTVIRVRGMGRAVVTWDDGQTFTHETKELQFEKHGHAPLEKPDA
jgi:hypothetical protein